MVRCLPAQETSAGTSIIDTRVYKKMLSVAIVGAGPYGLSVAAHLRNRGIPFRIFGRPMDSWLRHMPEGMTLKSDGFASNIYDPDGDFTLESFCKERGIEYAHTGLPVRLETFATYGLAFSQRMVPELEDRLVVSLERSAKGFLLRLDTGETVSASKVILAVGITHFEFIPRSLAHLPPELLSHSFQHHDLEPFRDRKIVVIGGGASAIDLAGLLHENRAAVHLVTRQKELKFHSAPSGKPRSQWQQIRHPQSGLGPGLRSRFFADAPAVFYYLPKRLRLEAVRRSLGPSGGWFAKAKVVGRVPLLMGKTVERAEAGNDGGVRLSLRGADGSKGEISAEHVISATGYKVDLDRLTFLSPVIRTALKAVEKTPVLSATFESSIPGLYFVGVAAANSFGPVMRFAFGAGFAARTLTSAIARAFAASRASLSVSSAVSVAK
jgi:thioredoxin reductase